jgi:hypothetical protein
VAAHAVTDTAAEPRAMLLDYSAVSRRVPLSNLYERGRYLAALTTLGSDLRKNRSLAMLTNALTWDDARLVRHIHSAFP